MSDNIIFRNEKPSSQKSEADFELEIRSELDSIADQWKSSLADKLTKKFMDFEILYKNKNNSQSHELATENKELKAKLYDCLTRVLEHEKELESAKSSLQDLLLAYTDLSERYQERSRELESVKDELEKCLGTSGTFMVKGDENDDDEDEMLQMEARERAQKAIEQIDQVTKSSGSSSKFQTASHLNDLKPRIKSTPVASNSSFKQNNSFISTREPSSGRSSASHVSLVGSLDDDMIVEASPIKKRKQDETLNESIKSVMPLNPDVLDRLFIESKHSATIFAGKLLRKYFTNQELTRNCNVRGNRCTRSKDPGVPRERLDPARVELIQRHIMDRTGGYNEEVWQRCIAKMNFIMNRLRKAREEKTRIV